MSITGAVRAAVTRFDPYPGADLVIDPSGRKGRRHYQRNGIFYPTLAAFIASISATPIRSSAAMAWTQGGYLVPFATGEGRETDSGLFLGQAAQGLYTRWDPTTAQIGTTGNCSDTTAPANAPLSGRNWIALDNTAGTAYAYPAITSTAASTQVTCSVLCETQDGSSPVYGSLNSSNDFRFVGAGAGALTSESVRYVRRSGNVWEVIVTGLLPAGGASTYIGLLRHTLHNTRALKFSGFTAVTGAVEAPPIIATGSALNILADNLALGTSALPAEGTIILTYVVPPAAVGSAARTYGWFGFDTGNSRFCLRAGDIGSATTPVALCGDGSAITALTGTSLTPGSVAKIAVAYSTLSAQFAMCVNGVDQTAARQLAAAALAYNLNVGGVGGANALNSPFHSFEIYPRFMSAAERIGRTL